MGLRANENTSVKRTYDKSPSTILREVNIARPFRNPAWSRESPRLVLSGLGFWVLV